MAKGSNFKSWKCVNTCSCTIRSFLLTFHDADRKNHFMRTLSPRCGRYVYPYDPCLSFLHTTGTVAWPRISAQFPTDCFYGQHKRVLHGPDIWCHAGACTTNPFVPDAHTQSFPSRPVRLQIGLTLRNVGVGAGLGGFCLLSLLFSLSPLPVARK